MELMEKMGDEDEVIRLFVNPQQPPGQEFLEVTPEQLDEYIAEQKASKLPRRRRTQHHPLGIMAKVDAQTTELEVDRLLSNDVRTLLVQKNYLKCTHLEQVFLIIKKCVATFHEASPIRTPIGIAVEITGELLITGRMRNDDILIVERGHIIILTTNEDYRHCSFKEIVFVSNLWRYLEVLRLGDTIILEQLPERIIVEVVKCNAMCPITVKVVSPGIMSSFMRVKMPCYVDAKELDGRDKSDLNLSMALGANILVVPGIRSLKFLQAIKAYVEKDISKISLVGNFDLEYMNSKFIDIADYLVELDGGVLIEDLFIPARQKILTSAIAQCRKQGKAVIGSVPLRKCSDFKKLENHFRIKQMDTLMIQKSPLRMKFPIIAKKLIPVGDRKVAIPQNTELSCKVGIVNFVLRAIYSIPCQGIVVTNLCPRAAEAFSIFEVYCPVIVVVDNDHMGCLLNLRKNLKTILRQDGVPDLSMAVEFGRKQGLFDTGDFVIAISDGVGEEGKVCLNLKAYFLPPTEEEMQIEA